MRFFTFSSTMLSMGIALDRAHIGISRLFCYRFACDAPPVLKLEPAECAALPAETDVVGLYQGSLRIASPLEDAAHSRIILAHHGHAQNDTRALVVVQGTSWRILAGDPQTLTAVQDVGAIVIMHPGDTLMRMSPERPNGDTLVYDPRIDMCSVPFRSDWPSILAGLRSPPRIPSDEAGTQTPAMC